MDEETTNNNSDELDFEPEGEKPDKPPRAELRNKDLSDKLGQTAKERDEANAKAEKAQKDLEFYKGFSTISAKEEYKAASEHQDEIKKKVNAGYDLEDATISVLAKAGQLGSPEVEIESPAGGSASTAITNPDDKPVEEMTTAEKREKLLEMERTNPGELQKTLRSINLG